MANLALQADEQLLWKGAPHRASNSALWFGLFGLSIIGLVSAPLVYAMASNDMAVFEHVTFTVNGKPVTAETPIQTIRSAAIGMGVLAATWLIFVLIWRALSVRQFYALTNKRAIVRRAPQFSRTVSTPISSIISVERSGGQEIGSITFFGREPTVIDRLMAFYQVPPNKFLNITSPNEVEALLLDTIAQCRKDPL